MAFPPFKNISPADPVTDKLERNVSEAFARVLASKILDGVLIESVALVTGSANRISHKLQRRPNGYIVVKKTATSDIWDLDYTDPDVARLFLQLYCSANTSVSLWVF